MAEKTIVHVEVNQKAVSSLSKTLLRGIVLDYLHSGNMIEDRKQLTEKDFPHESPLRFHVEDIRLSVEGSLPQVPLSRADMRVHIFVMDVIGGQPEELDENEGIQAANVYMLPSKEFCGVWENLVYDDNIKEDLLRYTETALLLAQAGIDTNLASLNRVVLLHGPPGTGKTSLAKALAQKLSIRNSDKYDCSQLVEINSHSLFSKWFSESGKLVMKMFNVITELIENPRCFVCLLIDEVESLSAVRKVNSNEPSDAIRVVNALLTQIDALKRFPNVLVLTTSNVTGTIDLAFVDRADIKRYIGHPSKLAVYKMLSESIQEFMRKKLVDEENFGEAAEIDNAIDFKGDEHSGNLRAISESCVGLSGRTIRKLPVMAAVRIRSFPTTLSNFLLGLEGAVQELKSDISKLHPIETK